MERFPLFFILAHVVEALCWRLGRGLFWLWCSIPLYPLGSREQKRPSAADFMVPVLLSHGDRASGTAIVAGRYTFFGETIEDSPERWFPLPASSAWREEMHGFSWLNDLAARGGTHTVSVAQSLMLDWAERCRYWSLPGWRVDILARRLYHWVHFAPIVMRGLQTSEQDRLWRSVFGQFAHLRRALIWEGSGRDSLSVLAMTVSLGLCLYSERHSSVRVDLKRLERTIGQRILPDGGEIGRNPEQQMRTLLRLTELRELYSEAGLLPPSFLISAIDRMVLFMRALMHGDGRLSVFNGGGEANDSIIRTILQASDLKMRPPETLTYSGFQRLSAGEMVAVVDSGGPPFRPAEGAAPHAGLFSLELSYEGRRIIVNCGAQKGVVLPAWRTASGTSAAHSTLTVGDRDACRFFPPGGWHMVRTRYERRKDNATVILSLSHNGYGRRFGLLCRRELHLPEDGLSLWGVDRLEGRAGCRFSTRFHLHPSVHATLTRGGHEAVMRIAGKKWLIRFQTQGALLSLQNSIYCGDSGNMHNTSQLVLDGETRPGETVAAWRLLIERG